MAVYDQHTVSIIVQGPRHPLAWDGVSQYLFESVTNNARFYGVLLTPDAAPTRDNGFGFTDTTTSNAFFAGNTHFVYPGIVPVPLYVDAEATNKYQMGVLGVDGITVTELSRVPYPTQTNTSSGFLRAWLVFPDNPTIIMYGNTNASTPVVEAWQSTIDSDGIISAPTSLGTVTYPDPGTVPGGGSHYAANISAPQAFSSRLAYQPNTRIIYDRLNPLTLIDAYALFSVLGGGGPQYGGFYMDARALPGHLINTRRDSSNTTVDSILDISVATAGTSMTLADSWTPPSGTTGAVAGFTASGKVVALTQVGTDTPRMFVDIFGAEFEMPDPEIGLDGYGYIVPALPSSDTFLLNDNADSTMVQFDRNTEILRNLVINPSAEQSFDRAWNASNGTIDTNVAWHVGDVVPLPGGGEPEEPPTPPTDDGLPDDLTGYTQLTSPGSNAATTLQNALDSDGKVALMGGDWLCSANILFDSDMELYVGPSVNLWRNYSSSGATSSAFLRNRNLNTMISNVIMWGPGNIAAKSGKTGNLLSFACDGFRSDGWQTTYWNGGRHTMIAGDDIHFSNHVWRADTGSTSGSGGLRFSGGDNFLGENLDVISGDDVYQFVPAGAPADPLFNLMDTTNGLYQNCVGQSYSGRLCVVGLQDSNGNGTTTLGMTTSISDNVFLNISGYGGGSAVNVANHSSTGTIDHLTFTNVTVDQSRTLSPTHGQPGEVYVQREGTTCGNVDHIDFGGVTILHKRTAKSLLYISAPFGGVTNITSPVAG